MKVKINLVKEPFAVTKHNAIRYVLPVLWMTPHFT